MNIDFPVLESQEAGFILGAPGWALGGRRAAVEGLAVRKFFRMLMSRLLRLSAETARLDMDHPSETRHVTIRRMFDTQTKRT